MNLLSDIDLKDLVRTIPDYPKPGIMFRDITTLLGHANGFRACVEQLAGPFLDRRVQAVAGIEARGFILGGAVADRLRCGFVPIRKKGKLPGKAIGQDYELEYGIDVIEIHEDAIGAGDRRVRVRRRRRRSGGGHGGSSGCELSSAHEGRTDRIDRHTPGAALPHPVRTRSSSIEAPHPVPRQQGHE